MTIVKEHNTLLSVEKVSKSFTAPTFYKVLHDVDLQISQGSIHSLVGESGSGKTTLANIILGFLRPEHGKIFFEDQDITYLNDQARKPLRRSMQVVFQNTASALNPFLKVHEALSEPFLIHKDHFGTLDTKALLEKAEELLLLVGLSSSDLFRYTKDFSGGQKQRLNIARAIALKPKLLLADEPVSNLDVTIKVQILDLLLKLKRELGLSMLLISHDLYTVRHVSDVISIIHQGKIVETGHAARLIKDPQHFYTKLLLDSVVLP